MLPLPGAPADRAGLRPGDVIVELDGASVGRVDDGFVPALQRLGAGHTATLVVLRGKERRTIQTTLAKAADIRQDPGISERRIDAYEAIQRIFDRGTFPHEWAAGVLGTLWPVSDSATALLMAKFYDLHMGERLAPPSALRQAQLWLRAATDADINAYIKGAAKKGRLEPRHVTEIDQELSDLGLKRSRNSALIEWIAPDTTLAPGKKGPGRASRRHRPYAHPYFWAGFIYTGL